MAVLTEAERDYIAAVAIDARGLDDVVRMVEQILTARLTAALPAPVGEEDLVEYVKSLPAWRNLSHAIEYDPTWPDGKPNLCIYCDEALAQGDEMCGHNAALMDLATQIRAGWVLTPRGGVQGSQGVTEALEGLRTDPSATEAPGEAQIEGKP